MPWDVIRSENWNNYQDGKRQRNAEFLIHPKVPVSRIWRFVVNNNQLKQELSRKLNRAGLDKEIEVDKWCFF